jgi:NADH-quinone oxidoreductase subunit N
LLFGATGSTYIADVVMAQPTPVMVLAVVLTLAGVFFKMAVLPFHAWAPDTYQGAPHQVATFIGTASKVAAVGLLIRVLTFVDAEAVHILVAVLAVASMTVGNLTALAQRDLKRLLGWSTVAQAGYVLLAVVTLSENGVAAAIFYAMIYLLVSFAAFMVVAWVGGEDNPTLESLNGLYQRAPILAALLLVGMFGLAGIPPTPGFAGKWFIFSAAMEGGYFWLVFVGAVNATVSLYYYLRVVRFAYLHPPGDRPTITVSTPARAAAWIAMGLVVVTGFLPGPLWDLATGAARAVLGIG